MPRVRDRNGRQSRLPVTPLPHRRVIILGLILALNNWSIWMIFSFFPYIKSSFYPDLSLVELGYKAGYLGAAFSGGSVFGNVLWGVIADKYGRRLALLNGLIGTMIAAILFGFSPSFSAAVALRFLWGFLNGDIGVSKTYIGEILDDTNTPKGMALYGIIGGMGRFIGPLVGVYFVSPADRYSVFHGTVFVDFPFALPSTMVAVSCGFVLFFAYFELQETLKIRQKMDPLDKKRATESRGKKTVRRGTAEYSMISNIDFDIEGDNDTEEPAGGLGPFHSSMVPSASSAYRAIYSTQHLKEKSSMKPVTAMKKSLSLALPLLSLHLPSDITNSSEDDFLGAMTPSTARIEASFPSHFRLKADPDTLDNRLGLRETLGQFPDGFQSSHRGSEVLCGGEEGVGNVDEDEEGASGISLFPFRDDDLVLRLEELIEKETGGTGQGLGQGVCVGGDVGCVPIEYNKTSAGCGKRISRDFEGRESEKTRKSDWDRKRGEKEMGGESESALSQSPSRRVSFSSLVMVKVIGSSSLGIGQLKHVRPDDHPVDDIDSRTGAGVGGFPLSGLGSRAHTDGDRPNIMGSPSGVPTRYSNGSEFNTSLAARNGSLAQRVRYLLSKRQILVTTLMYGTNGLIQLLFAEMVSLWLVAPPDKGGFGFDGNALGAAIVVSAVMTVFMQLSVYPVMVEQQGVLTAYRFGCTLFAFTLFAMPLISLFKGYATSALAVWAMVVVSLTCIGTAMMFTLISIFILINNSCYSHERATVNGIGQVSVSLGRVCGPFLVAEFIAWNKNGRTDWLFNYFVLGVASLLTSRLAVLLPRSIERKRREPREPRYAYSACVGDPQDYSELEDLIAEGEGETEGEEGVGISPFEGVGLGGQSGDSNIGSRVHGGTEDFAPAPTPVI